MNIRHLPLLLATGLLTLTVGCASVATPEPIPVSAATTPSERLSIGWWKARLAEKEAQAKTQHDTVFIGDSITHNWDNIAPDLQKQYFGDVLNLGFSGDKTQEVLWRIARIDWQTVAPKRIMLMIGTNNTGHGAGEKPENTFNGIKAIVRQLRASCPEAKITLLKIFPRGANGQDPKRKLNDAINARLPELADEEHVFLRDVGPYYLMPDGDTLNKALLPDLLHPTKEGHRLWAAAIARDFLNDYE